MYSILRRVSLIVQMILLPLLITGVFADPPGPPGPGGNPAGNGGVPVGAPIDNGIGVLLGLGMVYGSYKIFEIWKRRASLTDDDPQ